MDEYDDFIETCPCGYIDDDEVRNGAKTSAKMLEMMKVVYSSDTSQSEKENSFNKFKDFFMKLKYSCESSDKYLSPHFLYIWEKMCFPNLGKNACSKKEHREYDLKITDFIIEFDSDISHDMCITSIECGNITLLDQIYASLKIYGVPSDVSPNDIHTALNSNQIDVLKHLYYNLEVPYENPFILYFCDGYQICEKCDAFLKEVTEDWKQGIYRGEFCVKPAK